MTRGTDVVIASVFNSGLLAQHAPQSGATYAYDVAPPAMLARARQLASICEEFDVTLPQAALHFPLRHPAVVSIALGARTPREIETDIDWMTSPVPAEL